MAYKRIRVQKWKSEECINSSQINMKDETIWGGGGTEQYFMFMIHNS